MLINTVLKNLSLFLVLGLIFSACNKEEPIETTQRGSSSLQVLTNSRDSTSSDDGLDECFSFEFPVEILYPDQSTKEVQSMEELENTVDDWYEINWETGEDLTLVYPVTANYEGQAVVLNSDDDLFELLDQCEEFYEDEGHHEDCPEEDWFEDCFEINYPITLRYTDGRTLVVGSDEEFEKAYEDLILEDSEEDILIEFPISVTMEDGETVEVKSEDEFDQLIEECADFFDDFYEEEWLEECFEFNYPITLLYSDGSKLVVSSDEEFEKAYEDLILEDSEEDILIEFPISVTMEDGEVVDVASEDDFDELIEACIGLDEDDFDGN